MEFTVYEMQYCKEEVPYEKISCVPFDPERFEEYKTIYNAGFHEMRRALGIEPYDFLHSFEQIEDKTKDIALWIVDGEIAGTVACYGNEVDDLVIALIKKGTGSIGLDGRNFRGFLFRRSLHNRNLLILQAGDSCCAKTYSSIQPFSAV